MAGVRPSGSDTMCSNNVIFNNRRPHQVRVMVSDLEGLTPSYHRVGTGFSPR